jgi:signal transduction histidine kinase
VHAVHPGLRLQIVLALGGLMLLAFGPLYFAVASLSRATVAAEQERAAEALGRAVAAHVADARSGDDPGAVARVLRAHADSPDVVALCAFGDDGTRIGCAGAPSVFPAIRPPPLQHLVHVRHVRGADGRSEPEVAARFAGGSVVARLRVDAQPDGALALVRLVALYMLVFALALLVFAAFVLTRLIVRPIEGLVDAADRVASGLRTLRFPRGGARELVELGASVQAMAEKLIAEEAALRAKVEELTRTTTRLTETQSQLVRSERMASVGRLAAGLAHEVGNPLAALMGMQDLLIDGGLPRDAQLDFLNRMRRETQRIHAVVRDLLDFARPERDEPGASPHGSADVRAVVDDVASLVRPQRPFRSVSLEVNVAGTPQVAFAAPRLTQVLLNLVLNAGAAVASTGREGRVRVCASAAAGERVRIDVEDDGPGVAPEIRERLFEPFTTTKDVGEGTGLGLAVCRGLVESAGGEIGFDASYAAGARFYVILPAARP